MNVAESSAMKLLLKEHGWEAAAAAEDADLVIINTCSVRKGAETRVFGRLAHFYALKKQMSRAGKRLFILITGCMARLKDQLLEAGADFVSGAGDLPETLLTLGDFKGAQGGDFPPLMFAKSYYEEGAVRSLVPIMNGCNNFCSYCIVPYTRGREVSRAPHDIIAEIRFLGARGVREITLIGQNVNSYNYDGPQGGEKIDFPALLQIVGGAAEGAGIKRVRFLTSHPKDFSSAAIDVLKANRVFCPHIHLCAQHGSDRILALMNRKYTREGYLRLAALIKREIPEITLSTDLLVGFPGETEEDFNEILTLMEEVKFLYSFMYYYNPREGTAAVNFPSPVPLEVKKARLARVIALQKEHTQELLTRRLGSIDEVLVEGVSKRDKNFLLCRTGRDETAVLKGGRELIGSFQNVRLESLRGNTFVAKAV